MSITKDKLRELRSDIDAALRAVAQKHNLSKLSAGNCTFGDSNFTFKLEGLVAGGLTKEQSFYEQMRRFDPGFPPRDTQFFDHGKRWSVHGMKARGRTVICKNLEDGRLYSLPYETVKKAGK